MRHNIYTKFQRGRKNSFPYFFMGEYLIIEIVLDDNECTDAEIGLKISVLIGQWVSQLLQNSIASFVVARIAEKLDQYCEGIRKTNIGGGVIAEIGLGLPGVSSGFDTFKTKALPKPTIISTNTTNIYGKHNSPYSQGKGDHPYNLEYTP
jgi:hypothetical protein